MSVFLFISFLFGFVNVVRCRSQLNTLHHGLLSFPSLFKLKGDAC